MRLILTVFLILSFSATAQQATNQGDEMPTADPTSVEAQTVEELVQARKEALAGIVATVYEEGDNPSDFRKMTEEDILELAQQLSECTYEGQHGVAQLDETLEREDCTTVITQAWQGGVAEADLDSAIEKAAEIVFVTKY